MLVSTPAIGAETYACFKQGIDNPEPKKFVMSADGAEFFDTIYKLKKWQVHSEQDDCNASYQYLDWAKGFSEVACFNRKESEIYTSGTTFGTYGDSQTSLTANVTWRCIAID